MSYTPTVWNENDIITAEKLNNLESGVDDLILDLGQIELTIEEGNSKGGIISLNENQVNKIKNENLIGVKVTLPVQNNSFDYIDCILQKVGMIEDSPYFYFYQAIGSDSLNLNINITGVYLEYNEITAFQIIYYDLKAIEDSSIIDIGDFEGLEDLIDATGTLNINSYTFENDYNNLKIRFSIDGSYGEARKVYYLPYLYSDVLGGNWFEYYFGKEEIIDDILHSYRVVIERRGDVYTSKMTYKTYNLSSLISS